MFKDKYKKDNEAIKPSEAVLSELSSKMKDAAAAAKPKRYPLFLKIAAAFSVVLLIGIIAALKINSPATNVSPLANNGFQADDAVPVAASAIGDITITPLKASKLGVEVDSAFLVTAKIPLSLGELREKLSIKSGEPFGIEQDGNSAGNEFLLSFENPLENNRIYNFEYQAADKQPLSFAFQTVSTFRIVATMPANDGYSVPVNSGIEMTFNEEIDGDFKDYFSIEPNVEGRFEQVGYTHIFVPKRMNYETTYNITIKGDIKGKSGNTLGTDYEFSFRTQWEQLSEYCSIYGNIYETFLPDDDVYVEMNVSSGLSGNTYDVEIYDLVTPENFIGCSGDDRRTISIPSGARLLEMFTTELTEANIGERYGYRTMRALVLNKPLPEGYYLFNIKTTLNNQEYSAIKLIQVSALSVYSASLQGETCFWVNDTNTGAAAPSAKINLDGKTGVTDGDGKAIIKTAANNNSVVKIDYLDYPSHVYRNYTYDPLELRLDQKYYTYMYTDRPYYKPNDTIDIFGVINPIRKEFALGAGDEVTLQMGDMLEIPVTLDGYGSFAVKIPVEDMYGYVSIRLCLNGEVLIYRSVQFLDYSKDKYIISSQADRRAYFAGETAEVDLSVTTYDNSPVEGVEIKDNNAAGPNLTTSGIGTASASVKINTYEGGKSWHPYSDYLGFSIAGIEEYSQSIYTPVYILPSDTMLELKTVSDSSVEFTVSLIDRDAIERYIHQNGYYYADSDVYRGRPADADITVEIYKAETTRVKTGDTYDFIQKVNVPQYEYNREETLFETRSLSTVNGKALVENLPISGDPYVYYYGKVRFKDGKGREFSEDFYFGKGYRSYGDDYSYKEYYFKLNREQADESAWQSSLRLNETGNISLHYYTQNDDDSVTEGKILTILSSEKIIAAAVGSPEGTPLTFTEDCIHYSRVYGAYFDGKYVCQMEYAMYIGYDSSERKLNFDVTYDKDEYRPGDEITATVKVTDENGRPKKSLVNISVVDESVFSRERHEAYFLSNYYGSVYIYGESYIYTSYWRHGYGGYGGGAEQGGGGDNFDVRKDFVDNPAFKSVETDDRGIAVVKLKLSDSITSWRVTAHAVTTDGFAGNEKTNVITTMPYYVDMVMSDEFVAGDEVSVVVKSFGSAYKLNRTVAEYTVEVLKGDEIIYTETKSSMSYAGFNAGKLPEGEYTVQVKSVAGGYKDAMEKPVSVVKDAITLPLMSRQILSDDSPALSRLNVAGSPVRVAMFNGDISYITDILSSCISYSSERTDYKASTAFANYFLDGLYDRRQTDAQPSYVQELKDYFSRYGGIPELPYGYSDFYYTSRFAACFPELINKSSLITYITEYETANMYKNAVSGQRGVVTDESDDAEAEAARAAGYLALAAAGESVLLEIYDQVEIIRNSADQEKFINNYYDHLRVLYYTAALCAIGDDGGAYDLMAQYPASSGILKDVSDSKAKQHCEENINTLMLYINTTINPPKAYEYLKTKANNEYVSDVCEKVTFIKKTVPVSGTASEVQYTLNGETKTVKLTNFDRASLSISKEQFEGLNLKQISGNTAVNISFYGGGNNLIESYNKIKIGKNVLTEQQYANRSAVNNLYYITLDVQMPAGTPRGYYAIRDRVPTNMRFTESVDTGGRTNYYVSNPEKQSVVIGFYYDGGGGNVKVMYNALKVTDAEAVIGPAYVSGGFSLNEMWGASK